MTCCCSHCDCDGSSRYRYAVGDILDVLNSIDFSKPPSDVYGSGHCHTRVYETDAGWTITLAFRGDRLDYIVGLLSPYGDMVNVTQWPITDDGDPALKAVLWEPRKVAGACDLQKPAAS